MKKDGVYFENLDSIRFIAATMVFLHHSTPSLFALLNFKGTWQEAIMNVLCDGGVGVSVFFVLSGFLITYLLISEFDLNSKISIRNFYIRRVLRIWPLYFAVIAFSYGIAPILDLISPHNHYTCSPSYGYYLFFLGNFDVLYRGEHDLQISVFQIVTWSVSVEEQFYLFWPLIFTFLSKKYWVFAIIIIITCSLIFRVVYHQNSICLNYNTFSVLLDLGVGGLFAYLIKKYEQVNVFFENTSTWTHLILFTSTFALLLLRPRFALFNYGIAVSRIVISIFFALIIVSQALTKSKSRLNLGNLHFANNWGKYTYGIYLLHHVALFILTNSLGHLHINMQTVPLQIIYILSSFAFTLFISYLSYTYYELWFLKLKRRFEIIHT